MNDPIPSLNLDYLRLQLCFPDWAPSGRCGRWGVNIKHSTTAPNTVFRACRFFFSASCGKINSLNRCFLSMQIPAGQYSIWWPYCGNSVQTPLHPTFTFVLHRCFGLRAFTEVSVCSFALQKQQGGFDTHTYYVHIFSLFIFMSLNCLLHRLNLLDKHPFCKTLILKVFKN